MIYMLCTTPDLLNEIQFTVELWQEQHLDTLHVTGRLKDRIDLHEVRLIVEESAATAPDFTRQTPESFAFGLQFQFGLKSALLKDLCHSFEPASFLISIGEIEELRLPIGKASRFHRNLHLLWLAIRMAHYSTIGILDRDSDSP